MQVFFDQTPWVRAPKSSVGMCALYLSKAIQEMRGPSTRWGFENVSRVKVGAEAWGQQDLLHSIRKLGFFEKISGREGVLLHSIDSVLPRWKSGKCVLTLHDCWTLEKNPWQSPDFQRKKKPKLLRSIERADHIVTPTLHVKEELKRLMPQLDTPVSVIPWGPMLPTNPFNDDPQKSVQKDAPVAKYLSKGRAFFLCVANFENRKNHKLLIQAMQEIPHMDLVLVGNEGYGSEHVRELIDNNKAGAIEHFSALSPHALSLLYKRARALVLTSFDEGFGLPAAEGLYYNKAMVLSQIAPLHEVAGEAAMYVDPHLGHKDLVSYLRALAEDDALVETFAHKCEARKHLFNWSLAAKRYVEVYKKVAS
jgi:glycosyltransferase involved in cell wall biosynthesis